MKVPHGLKEVEKTFGKFSYTEQSGGYVDIDDRWEEENLVLVKNVCGTGLSIRLHKDVVDPFVNGLATAMASCSRYKIRMLGGFCGRHQMHNPKNPLSLHSWGVAFDLNWNKNLVISASAPKEKLLKACDMPIELVKAFEEEGFEWGGRWKRTKDFMHFQFATGC